MAGNPFEYRSINRDQFCDEAQEVRLQGDRLKSLPWSAHERVLGLQVPRLLRPEALPARTASTTQSSAVEMTHAQ